MSHLKFVLFVFVFLKLDRRSHCKRPKGSILLNAELRKKLYGTNTAQQQTYKQIRLLYCSVMVFTAIYSTRWRMRRCHASPPRVFTWWHLTFRNHASYMQDGHTAFLKTPHFIYIFNKYMYWIFLKCCTLSVLSPSKCRLFHNTTFFGTCIIHILHTGVLKFKCQIPVPKG
jgi:hypothetical protein